jgi:hypothetical protein
MQAVAQTLWQDLPENDKLRGAFLQQDRRLHLLVNFVPFVLQLRLSSPPRPFLLILEGNGRFLLNRRFGNVDMKEYLRRREDPDAEPIDR